MPKPILTAALAGALALSPLAQTALTTRLVASGFSKPLLVTAPAGDEDRLFVVEQTGCIRIIREGVVRTAPYLDLSASVEHGVERGLLGLAFHPRYARNGELFVNYTRRGDGATVVERYRVSSDPDRADPRSGTAVLGPIPQPFDNHNGGCLAFGPDGFLYVGTGDGGGAGDPSCNAQNGQSLLGKLLRIDVDSPTRVPPSNPFVDDPSVRDEVWALGVRNPWRFSFDAATGDLYLGDVGQGGAEEVDFQPAFSVGGENYGWRVMEAFACFSSSGCGLNTPLCGSRALTAPIHHYARIDGCSIIGGHVYRGCAIPDLRGTYFFGDFCSARVWSFRYDGVRLTDFRERTIELRPPAGSSLRWISSFGVDARGELYITNVDGDVLQIVPRVVGPAVDLGFGGVGSNGEVPRFEVCGLLTPGQSAQFILRRAPANTAAVLLLSRNRNPTAYPGIGVLVPIPIEIALEAATDADGRLQFGLAGPVGGGPMVWYGQWVLVDRGLPGGFVTSNALQITFG